MIPNDACLIWWARLAEHQTQHEAVLTAREIERAGLMHRAEDRNRQLLGAVLLRLAAGAATGTPPNLVRVDRTCPRCTKPHGRPRLPGTGLHASITHSGALVGLALTATAPVGLDVEQISDVDANGLSRIVLHPDERCGTDEFFVYWTRKEAVVKATGDGLSVSLAQVRVSSPAQHPRLLSYPGCADLSVQLMDLLPAPGYPAALALLTTEPVRVIERFGAHLLVPRTTHLPAGFDVRECDGIESAATRTIRGVDVAAPCDAHPFTAAADVG